MLARLLTSVRRDRGATDPILVIAAIAVSLVLLVGGSFAVAGMINNGKDMNAKSDLDKIATAQAAAQSDGGKYLAYFAADGNTQTFGSTKDSKGNYLSQGSIGFTLSSTVDVFNTSDPTATTWDGSTWFAVVKSGTGKMFARSAGSSKIVEVSDAGLSTYQLQSVTGNPSIDVASF